MVSLVFDVASSSYEKGKTRPKPRYFHNERCLFFIFDQPPDSWIFLLAAPDSLSIHGLPWLMIVVVTACAGAIGRDAWTYVHGVTRSAGAKWFMTYGRRKKMNWKIDWKNWMDFLGSQFLFDALVDQWFRLIDEFVRIECMLLCRNICSQFVGTMNEFD